MCFSFYYKTIPYVFSSFKDILWANLIRTYFSTVVLLSKFQFDENARSPFVKIWKTILHPGEVSVTIIVLSAVEYNYHYHCFICYGI